MNQKLSRRLSACLDELSSFSKIADIGTDHAYLPCQAIASGKIDLAIAIDVGDGPLAQAKQAISDYGLADKIELRKGSGLKPLKVGEVEGINIAGMGGKLISQLLLDSLTVAKSMKILVFQPQGGEVILRKMLCEHSFAITNEQLLEEDGIIYTIITAMPDQLNQKKISYKDLVFGPILIKNVKDELFIKKWHQEIVTIDKIIVKIPEGNERKKAFKLKKELIQEVLASVVS